MTTLRRFTSSALRPLVFLFALFAIPQAMAQVAVIPCTFTPYLGTGTMIGCASEWTAADTNRYLTTGVTMSPMGALGMDGLMPQLRALNSALSNGIEGDRQAMPNADLAARTREYDMRLRDAIARRHNVVSDAACYDASVGGGLGGGGPSGGGGAAGNTQRKYDDTADEAEAEVLKPLNNISALAQLAVGPYSQNYCTQQDVENKIPKCTTVGKYPGANTDASILRLGAAGKGQPRNYSIDFKKGDEQYEAVIDYIRMSRPRPAPDIPVASRETAAGRPYLAYQRRYNGRVLNVIHGLVGVASQSAKMDANNMFVTGVWKSDDVAKEYREINGQAPPDRPSERELLRFMVLRQFTSEKSKLDLADGVTVEAMTQRNLELSKINAYLMLKLTEQQDQTNVLLSHILANQIDPVSRAEIEQMAAKASSVRSGAQ